MNTIEVPRPITNFSKGNLSAKRRTRIVVSNSADPRACDFDCESTVFHNWPSQAHPGSISAWISRETHPKGFIEFTNGRKFDLETQTIYGVPKWLFNYDDVTVYWELYLERKRFIENLSALKDED